MRESLLDSDILSEILKARNPTVIGRYTKYMQVFETVSISSLSVMELLTGLRRINATVQMVRAEAMFARNIEIVPTSTDYRLAAEISGVLAQRGRPIGVVDPIIAACALHRDLVVATGNVAHFQFIREAGYAIEIENWRLSVSGPSEIT